MTLDWWTGGHVVVRRESPFNDPTGWNTFYAIKLRLDVRPVKVLWVSSTKRSALECHRDLRR